MSYGQPNYGGPAQGGYAQSGYGIPTNTNAGYSQNSTGYMGYNSGQGGYGAPPAQQGPSYGAAQQPQPYSGQTAYAPQAQQGYQQGLHQQQAGYVGAQQVGYQQNGYAQQQNCGVPQQQGQRPSGFSYQPPVGYQANPGLQQWFQAVDTDRSGQISARELSQALSRGGIQLSERNAEKLISLFDRDRSGQITFDEFQQLHPFIDTMSQGFKRRDRSGDGKLDANEVRQGLQEGGFAIQEGTFQTLLRKYDSGRKGYINFDDYVGMSIFLSNIRNTFQRYDTQRNGNATFNFDAFTDATLNAM